MLIRQIYNPISMAQCNFPSSEVSPEFHPRNQKPHGELNSRPPAMGLYAPGSHSRVAQAPSLPSIPGISNDFEEMLSLGWWRFCRYRLASKNELQEIGASMT